jgi:hypothetical protein
MPFTFSHPAIILPFTYLSKKYYSLTGLVVGSMTPDFEYFLRMSTKSRFSHSWAGVFWFDLPLGLLIAFVYHGLVREYFIRNLPKSLFIRTVSFNDFNWFAHFRTNWLIVFISIIVGSASHLFWDSFTHGNGYFVLKIPVLQHKILFDGNSIPVCEILQHVSTVVGGVIIGIFLYHLPKNETVKQERTKSYWTTIAILTVIFIVIRLVTGLNYRYFGDMIINCISAGLFAWVVTSVWIKINRGEMQLLKYTA